MSLYCYGECRYADSRGALCMLLAVVVAVAVLLLLLMLLLSLCQIFAKRKSFYRFPVYLKLAKKIEKNVLKAKSKGAFTLA